MIFARPAKPKPKNKRLHWHTRFVVFHPAMQFEDADNPLQKHRVFMEIVDRRYSNERRKWIYQNG